MKVVAHLLQKSLVRTFYRQYAGLFLFVYLLFFGIVAPSQQLSYHYTLILGMLETKLFFTGVLLGWLLYSLVCAHWVRSRLNRTEYRWLFILPGGKVKDLSRAILRAQALLLIPVSLYAAGVTVVGVCTGHLLSAAFVLLFVTMIHIAGTRLYGFWLMSVKRG